MRLSSWWDWIPLLLSLICHCSFPFSTRHRLPEPARTHRPGPITAPDGRRPLIGREVQAAACDVTSHMHWGALTAHVALPKFSCWLSYTPSMQTFIVKRGSGGRSQRDGTNVAIDIIIDIFDLLRKPSNLSYVFCIIFVSEDVSAFDECQLKFIVYYLI